MEELRFSPEERILSSMMLDDHSIYMIQKGCVEIIFDGTTFIGERFKKNALKNLAKGDYFGEGSFFTGDAR
jgi:potassium voltage-gated channel Eag-related subfamily H protein 7